MARALAPVAGAPAAQKRSRRVVNVAEMASVQRDVAQLSAWRTLLPQMQAKITSLEEELLAARSSVNGLHALQTAVRQDEFVMGKALQVSLRSRLIEKTRACPPVRRSVAHKPRTTLVVEVETVLRAVVQFVAMTKVVCTGYHKRGLGVRTVALSDRASLYGALGLTPSVINAVQSRVFQRRDGSKTARILLEHFVSDQGKIYYVIRRDADTATVACRTAETYDSRRKRHVHPLVMQALPYEQLPEDMLSSSACLTWKESRSSKLQLEELGDMVSGKVTVTIPISIVQGSADDVLALLS